MTIESYLAMLIAWMWLAGGALIWALIDDRDPVLSRSASTVCLLAFWPATLPLAYVFDLLIWWRDGNEKD